MNVAWRLVLIILFCVSVLIVFISLLIPFTHVVKKSRNSIFTAYNTRLCEANHNSDQVQDTVIDIESDQSDRDSTISISSQTFRIFKGDPADIREHPWTVAIGEQWWPAWFFPLKHNQFPATHCTGVILNQEWVLTASHCIKSPWATYWVAAGTDCLPELGGRLESDTQVAKVKRVIKFNETRLRKVRSWDDFRFVPIWEDVSSEWRATPADITQDVALLQFQRPGLDLTVNPSKVRKIQLSASCEWKEGEQLIVSGWGAVGPAAADYAKRLQQHTFNPPLGGTKQTRKERQWGIEMWARKSKDRKSNCLDDILCVPAGRGVPQTCFGDSGGPWVKYTEGKGHELLATTSSKAWSWRNHVSVKKGKPCGSGDLHYGVLVCPKKQWIHEAGVDL